MTKDELNVIAKGMGEPLGDVIVAFLAIAQALKSQPSFDRTLFDAEIKRNSKIVNSIRYRKRSWNPFWINRVQKSNQRTEGIQARVEEAYEEVIRRPAAQSATNLDQSISFGGDPVDNSRGT